ncbi:hypothetical protein SPBRAN_508 [uncultured Candidatus Thioglobus sp.]|nr:hypothetical protein SPBRAN_508 [uncultured Candidatus Thioglobus sp.]
MELYKFRPLGNCNDLKRIEDIITNGFYCCNFLKFNDMNEGVFSINQKNVNITLDQKEQYKICSFSGKNALNSQSMWGHYANAGMGVVIKVEVDNCTNIKNVIYSDNYNELNSIEDILTHKTTEWKYEYEYRCIVKDTNKCAIKREIGKITKIYFGTPYKPLKNCQDIEKKHIKLQKYLKLKEGLKNCIDSISCEDYDFNKIT